MSKKRKHKLIKISITHFETKMQYQRAILKNRKEKNLEKILPFAECKRESDYNEITKSRRQNGI